MLQDHNQLNKQIEELSVLLGKTKELLSAGNYEVIGDFVQISLSLANHLAQSKNFDFARNILAEALQRCQGLSYPTGEIWAMWPSLALADMCLQLGDWQLAKHYTTLVVESFTSLRNDIIYNPRPPDKMLIYEMLIRLTNAYYYQQKDFESAASLASQAVRLVPDQEAGYFLLGNCQIRLEQFESAVQTLESAIARKPEHADAYLNYAIALNNLGRSIEAIPALSKAIQLLPKNPRYYMVRGQTYQILNRHDLAINDFNYLLFLCGKIPDNAEPYTPTPGSLVEFGWDMPLRDLAHIARLLRTRSFQALGQIENALSDLQYLIQQGDQVMQSEAYLYQGDLFQSLNRYSEAIAAYSSAVALHPDNNDARKGRVDIYLRQNMLDEAIPDLASLARYDKDPDAAVERLDKILATQPDHPLARKWRGYGYQQTQRFSKAEEDFSYALKLLPADSEIYLWRGLTRMSSSSLPEEKAWNDSLSYARITGAIDDLGSAIHIDRNNSAAIAAFKWLVDRASADAHILLWLIKDGDREEGINSAVPSARDFLNQLQETFNLERLGQCSDAIHNYGVIQGKLLESGFPVWATRLHLNLADNYLSLYELQLCLDHLKQAENLYSITLQPLFARYVTEEMKQRLLLNSGWKPAEVETQYIEMYGIGYKSIALKIRLLKSLALAAIGDTEQSISALGNINDFVEAESVAGWTRENAFRSLIGIAGIMRDANRYADALELLAKSKVLVEQAREDMLYFNACGCVYRDLGDHGLALQHFQQARDLALKSGNSFFNTTQMNCASSYYCLKRYQEALNILEDVAHGLKAFSARDQYTFKAIMTSILFHLGRYTEAQEAALDALSFLENTRMKLRSFDVKINWLPDRENAYEQAVLIAQKNSDSATCFGLVERSKSRAFIDQLAIGHLPLPPTTKQLQEIVDFQRRKKDLLLQLNNSIKYFGGSFIDFAVLDRLKALDEQADVIEEGENGLQLLSAMKIVNQLAQIDDTLMRVNQEIEEARLASSIVTGGSTLSFSELRQILEDEQKSGS